jgi:hypothetical protein
MNKAWRKRNPVKVSPFSFTPSDIFSDTTFFTPTISEGCKGALKHLTWPTIAIKKQVVGVNKI